MQNNCNETIGYELYGIGNNHFNYQGSLLSERLLLDYEWIETV